MALLPSVSSAENFHLHALFSDQLETRLSAFQLEYLCHSCMCRDALRLTKSPRTIFHFVMGSGSFRLCPFMCLRRAAAAVHGRQDIVLLVSFPGRVRERDLHHHSFEERERACFCNSWKCRFNTMVMGHFSINLRSTNIALLMREFPTLTT